MNRISGLRLLLVPSPVPSYLDSGNSQRVWKQASYAFNPGPRRFVSGPFVGCGCLLIFHNITSFIRLTYFNTTTQAPLAAKEMVNDTKSLARDERKYLEGAQLAIMLGCVTLVSFLVLLDMSILGTVSPQHHKKLEMMNLHAQAIPRITTEFNALSDIGWYIGAYNLAAYILTATDIQQQS